MAEFNERVLQEYFDTRNYNGAADYLSSLTPKDGRSLAIIRDRIYKLRDKAAKQESMLKGISQEDQQAYHFISSLNGNGAVPRNRDIIYNANTSNQYTKQERNNFGQKYLNYKNNIKSKDNTRINRIGLEFDSEDDVLSISKYLGVQDIRQDNDLGITTVALGDGKYRLTTSLDNKNFHKLLKANNERNKTNIKEYLLAAGAGGLVGAGYGAKTGTIFGAHVGAGIGAAIGFVGGGIIGALEHFIRNWYDDSSTANVIGMDTNGTMYNEKDFDAKSLKKALKVINDAQERYDNLLKAKESSTEATYEVKVYEDAGIGDYIARKYLDQNLITIDEYKKISEQQRERYDRLLDSAILTDKKVYSWSADSKEGVLLTAMENKDITPLRSEILAAKNDKRLSIRFATVNGKIGTKLTIEPKVDKGIWGEGVSQIRKEIFIENLFNENTDAFYARDTKGKAVQRKEDMKEYKYEQTLENGTIVGYEEGTGYYRKEVTDRGQIRKVAMSNAQVLNLLNEDNIIKGAISTVLSNVDENGDFIDQSKTNPNASKSIEDYLLLVADQLAEEYYENASEENIPKLSYKRDIYNRMLSQTMKYINLLKSRK